MHLAATNFGNTKAVSKDRIAALPTPVLFYSSLVLVCLAFIRLLPNSSALSTGLTPGRMYETLLILIGFAIVPLTIMTRGYPLYLRLAGQIPLFAYCLWTLASATWSPSPWLSASKSFEMIALIGGAMLFVSGFDYIRQNRLDFTNALAAVLVGLVFFGLVANTFIHGRPFAMKGVDWSTPRPRLMLAHNHPIEYADLTSFALIALFASSYSWRKKACLFPALLLIHQMTDARISMAALAIAMLVAFFVKYPNKVRAIAAFVLFNIMLTYFAIITFGPRPDDLFGPILRLQPEDMENLNGRTGLWEHSIAKFQETPITGVGFYASRFAIMDEFKWAGDTHNAWIEALLTTGIIGFGLMVIVLLGALWVAFRTHDVLLVGVLFYILVCTYTAAPVISAKFPTLILLICLNEARVWLPGASQAWRPAISKPENLTLPSRVSATRANDYNTGASGR